jgi:hypothetical protein
MFYLLLACQINSSQQVALTPKDVTPTISFQRPKELGKLQIAAVGDVSLSSDVVYAAHNAMVMNESDVSINNDGYNALFTEIRPIIREADIAFANLNSPIAPNHRIRRGKSYYNGSPAALSALEHTGFDVVSIANSHSFDQGRAGLRETIERVERTSLTPLGAGRNCVDAKKAHHFKHNGIHIAILAASSIYKNYVDSGVKNTCVFRVQKVDDIEPIIRNAKDQGADIVILSMHWGDKYTNTPHSSVQSLAENIIDAGADIILGHYPEVLQPIEVYQAKDGRLGVIAYSMGSIINNKGSNYKAFIQGLSQGNTRDAGILQMELIKRDYGQDRIITEISNVQFIPAWITHNPEESQLPTILPRLIDDQILSVNSEIAIQTDESTQLFKKRELEFLFQRREHIGWQIGKEWLTPILE